MNFLAHLVLTEPTAEGWAGSLLPDLLRGSQRRIWSSGEGAIARAARLHRVVDRLTDAHPHHHACAAMFRPAVGRMAPVVTDVVFDYLLSRSWHKATAAAIPLPLHAEASPLPCPRPQFIAGVYRALAGQQPSLPEEMALALGRMIDQDWLTAYATHEGLERILFQMECRFSHRWQQTIRLTPAMQVVRTHGDTLQSHFDQFWSELCQSLRRACVSRSGS